MRWWYILYGFKRPEYQVLLPLREPIFMVRRRRRLCEGGGGIKPWPASCHRHQTHHTSNQSSPTVRAGNLLMLPRVADEYVSAPSPRLIRTNPQKLTADLSYLPVSIFGPGISEPRPHTKGSWFCEQETVGCPPPGVLPRFGAKSLYIPPFSVETYI